LTSRFGYIVLEAITKELCALALELEKIKKLDTQLKSGLFWPKLEPGLWNALHALNAIVHPMLSQFHAMFLGCYFSRKTSFIIQVKFSRLPGDSHMGSPSFIFFGIGDHDYIVSI